MKNFDSDKVLCQFSLIRSVDFISWSFLSFYCLVLVTMQDIYFSIFPYLMAAPLFTLMYGTLKLPDQFLPTIEWQSIVNRLRVFSLLLAFTFPFIIFVQLVEKNTYFAICCGLAIFALMQILIGLAELCHYVSREYQEFVLASEGRLAVRLVYAFAFVSVVIMALYMADLEIIRALKDKGLLDAVLKLSVLLLVFPLIFPVTLIFRLKFLMLRKYKEQVRKNYE
ncbi:MAG: hypothetical protein NE334_07710 [Lentisphaeraceae bacterium]|nr:hypothetical protein [Lentisphaeraceae bacterium]